MVLSNNTESSIVDSQYILLNENQDEEGPDNLEMSTQQNSSDKRKFPKRAHLQEDIDRQILKALEKPPNENEAFFILITPSVNTINIGTTVGYISISS